VGLISVASNVIPAQMAQMVGSAISGDWVTAQAINRQFYRLMQAHFWEASPAPVKAVLALMGRGEDRLRLPMTPVTAPTRRKLEVLLGELGLLAGAVASSEKVRMF
jgi:4-hydroxy-tetrahydrodipicolinate synthase